MTSIFGSSNHSCGVNFRKEMSSCSTSFDIECHFQNWLPNKFKIKQEGNASIDLWHSISTNPDTHMHKALNREFVPDRICHPV